ncbi:hypothetical protein FA13DRAFT_1740329, partial [Coprinellus micaceus]
STLFLACISCPQHFAEIGGLMASSRRLLSREVTRAANELSLVPPPSTSPMTLPDGFRVRPKPSTSRPTTSHAPTFFNSDKGKEKEESRSKKPMELKRVQPPTTAPFSKLANSHASGKSVLRPLAMGLAKPASQAKSLAKPGPSSPQVEFKVQPIPFYNPRASKPTPPIQSSRKPLSSSANVLKPLGIPKFKLPPTKPAIDPEKLKNMATNPMTKEGARELAAIMCAHRAKNAEPQDRDLGMSPERRDAKGRLKFVRGGLAERVHNYYRSAGTQTSLWQHEQDRNDRQWKELERGERKTTPLPIQSHHMELRIVKLLKRPTALRLERDPTSKPRPKARSSAVTSKPSRALTKQPKPLPPRAKPPATAIALCEVVSSHYATRELTRVFFKWPSIDPQGPMFKPTNKGWKEGALTLALKEWDTKRQVGYGLERLLGRRKAGRGGDDGKAMEVDGPASRKRPLEAGEDEMDIDSINPLQYRAVKKPRHSEERKSKPLPLPRNTQVSLDELKQLPVAEKSLIVGRFLLGPRPQRDFFTAISPRWAKTQGLIAVSCSWLGFPPAT